MTQKVSIVMLTCNNRAKAQRCLPTWLPLIQDDLVSEWLILDNASTDGTAAWLRQFSRRNHKIRVTYSGENLGCAGGRDVLFKRARGDLILSMDSDVRRVKRDAIATLARELENPRIGIVGDHGGGIRQDWSWTTETLQRFEGEIPIICGYCQMFRRSALEHVGLDLFFNPYWLEDSDFCFQLRDKLGQVGFVRRCGIQHMWSGTNSGGRPDQQVKWQYFKTKWFARFGDEVVYVPPKPEPKKAPSRKSARFPSHFPPSLRRRLR